MVAATIYPAFVMLLCFLLLVFAPIFRFLGSAGLAGELTWSKLMAERLGVARTLLHGGSTLAEALDSTEFFSPMALTILMGGEQVGYIAEALASVEEQSAKNTEYGLEAMQKLMEPLLRLFVGVMVGFIAIAAMAPTLQVIEGL